MAGGGWRFRAKVSRRGRLPHRRCWRQPMPSQPARLRLGGRDLAVSSAIAFAGLTVARLLGFLFSVAAARILVPVDYGRMAYGLALAAIASVLLSSSPIGLSRFLARETG